LTISIATTFLIGTKTENIILCIGFGICGIVFIFLGFKYVSSFIFFLIF